MQFFLADHDQSLSVNGTATDRTERRGKFTFDRLRHEKELTSKKSLTCYIIKIARPCGYLARDTDPSPGNMVIWRGWPRLNDIVLAATMAGDTNG